MDKIDITDKLILAPMAGYTDLAFRDICVKWGADIIYTEMVSAKAIRYNDINTKNMTKVTDFQYNNGKIGVQLFGHTVDDLKYGVEYLNSQESISLVDLNLGCPAPKIVKNGDGSALLRDPEKIYNILKGMRSETDKTLSAKIRLGIDKLDNYIEVSQGIEEAGADFIIVHGRTREEMYSGSADWDKIKEIVEGVSIPVVGNGDITTPKEAKEKSRYSGATGLMIGRGAIGHPWIFDMIKEYTLTGKYTEPSIDVKFDTIIDHINKAVKYKGERVGIPEMRKQLHGYFKGMDHSAKVKNEINTITNLEDLVKSIESYREFYKTL